MGNLPLDLKRGELADTAEKGKSTELELASPDLKRLLDGIPCIGEIAREGKDAAGKQLENEFYYVPEMDEDSMRRDAVVGGRGGTGLRAVRKSHKVSLIGVEGTWTDVHFSNTTGRNHDTNTEDERCSANCVGAFSWWQVIVVLPLFTTIEAWLEAMKMTITAASDHGLSLLLSSTTWSLDCCCSADYTSAKEYHTRTCITTHLLPV